MDVCDNQETTSVSSNLVLSGCQLPGYCTPHIECMSHAQSAFRKHTSNDIGWECHSLEIWYMDSSVDSSSCSIGVESVSSHSNGLDLTCLVTPENNRTFWVFHDIALENNAWHVSRIHVSSSDYWQNFCSMENVLEGHRFDVDRSSNLTGIWEKCSSSGRFTIDDTRLKNNSVK